MNFLVFRGCLKITSVHCVRVPMSTTQDNIWLDWCKKLNNSAESRFLGGEVR